MRVVAADLMAVAEIDQRGALLLARAGRAGAESVEGKKIIQASIRDKIFIKI
jgi:uncharacterized small protein (DUF1192 family)